MRLALPFPALDDRAQLFAFCAPIAAINAMAVLIGQAIDEQGTVNAVFSLAGISAVFWFALYAVIAIAREEGSAPLRPRDRMVALLTLGGALLPYPIAGSLAVLASGTWLALTGAPGSRERRIAVILLALTGTLLWGRILLQLFAPLMLGLDAQMVGWLAGTRVVGNTVTFVGSSEQFTIAHLCSSFHNISLAIILWAAATQLLGLRIDAKLCLICLAGVVAMASVNCLRLATLAWHPRDFDYWHVGAGAGWFGWASLAAGALVIGGGLLVARGTRH
ncbi:hypothetical protein OF829_06320 [Sphingomonas sp. LB-2]|uniref:hypothetical protein n=1 Tax=Sphingomonas caeni TaxID=2984949 RepID=UPI00223173DA|nr:hypothetical protein [Sphingomonas caeni]MCW3846848.1 hypothetical protein [Sphingomonas caeni]